MDGASGTGGTPWAPGERARPDWVRRWPHAWWLAVGTVCFGAFMGQLDASIVTLTYGHLQRSFHASLAGVEWVSLAYLVTLVALLVPVGRLSDAHGRKLVYLTGFVVFILASAACGLAPSLGALVAFRVVQGVGAAMLQSNSVALVATCAPRPQMRRALGVQAAAQAVGLAMGPTVGGLLVATVGWRWVFGVNVPVGVIAVVAGQLLLPRTRERTQTRRFDWTGTLLLGGATTVGLAGISAASGLGLPPAVVVGCLVLAAALVVALLAWESHHPEPLVDLALLRSPRVGAGLLGALGGYFLLFGPLVLVPVVFSERGLSPVAAGLVLTALPAGFALAALGAERVLSQRLGDLARCRVGALTALAALLALVVAPLPSAALVVVLAVLGLGLGVFTPANNSLVMGAIPARLAGTGGGLVNMARGLGTALGVALVTLALHLAGHPTAGPAPLAATGLLAVVGGLVAALVVRQARRPPAAPAQARPAEAPPAARR